MELDADEHPNLHSGTKTFASSPFEEGGYHIIGPCPRYATRLGDEGASAVVLLYELHIEVAVGGEPRFREFGFQPVFVVQELLDSGTDEAVEGEKRKRPTPDPSRQGGEGLAR
jgi:hypothetical protein